MQFAMATLCDAANVREGLVSVLSAGVTNLHRAGYPARLGLAAVCMIELFPSEVAVARKITVEVRSADHRDLTPLARLEGGWDSIEQADNERLATHVNLVFDFDGVILPNPGYYEVLIEVDGAEPRLLLLRANLASPID
jgi:hypothetical protein